jgi:hypothetical protein
MVIVQNLMKHQENQMCLCSFKHLFKLVIIKEALIYLSYLTKKIVYFRMKMPIFVLLDCLLYIAVAIVIATID